jgi:hypothetical protein
LFAFEDFEVEDGLLGLERDIYLSIVKFLDWLVCIKKSMSKYSFFFLIFVVFIFFILKTFPNAQKKDTAFNLIVKNK